MNEAGVIEQRRHSGGRRRMIRLGKIRVVGKRAARRRRKYSANPWRAGLHLYLFTGSGENLLLYCTFYSALPYSFLLSFSHHSISHTRQRAHRTAAENSSVRMTRRREESWGEKIAAGRREAGRGDLRPTGEMKRHGGRRARKWLPLLRRRCRGGRRAIHASAVAAFFFTWQEAGGGRSEGGHSEK